MRPPLIGAYVACKPASGLRQLGPAPEVGLGAVIRCPYGRETALQFQVGKHYAERPLDYFAPLLIVRAGADPGHGDELVGLLVIMAFAASGQPGAALPEP
jgi:hypothetical protein